MLAYTMVLLIILVGYIIHKAEGIANRAQREEELIIKRQIAPSPLDFIPNEDEEQAIVVE